VTALDSSAPAAAVRQIFPAGSSTAPLGDDALLALYSPADRSRRFVRANFVASVDGSATASGLSGSLGGPADRRVFDLLRQLSDVILVASGTVRAEGYAGPLVSDEVQAWRRERGWGQHPAVAVVSGSLSLDPAAAFFADAPVRPLVLTCDAADARRRAELEVVADVVSCGVDSVEPARLVAALAEQGLAQIHCEGGPTLLGSLVEADALDALALTVSPVLEGGAGPRIARRGGAPVDLRAMRLDHVLVADDGMLLTQHSRRR
jgi:riboflavin biosynthesis pyrimidine reductase